MTRKSQRSFTVWGLLFFLLIIGQRAFAQSIRLDLQNTDLAKVVAALQQQAPAINFSYSQEVLEKVHVDHVQVKAGQLEQALKILQEKYGLHYLMDGKNVTLKYVPFVTPPAAPAAETGKIEGSVADANGQPVTGATVHVKGTQYTVQTNEKGYY